MQPLLATAVDQLADLLGGPGRARAVWRALHRGADPFADGVLVDGARRRLAQVAAPTACVPVAERRADDGTLKWLLQLGDGARIETVLIPGAQRSTVCISTQVGCAHACAFCLTATLGLRRQLGADEIVAQVQLARVLTEQRGLPPLRNVVLMGMGEPLDNLAAVSAACALLTDHRALALAPRHLTVSTVGPSPRRILAARALPGQLAWSLHAADDALRRRLVVGARHPVAALRDAFAALLAARGDLLLVELALIDGVNDRAVDAARLVELLAPLQGRCRVNLLPVNPGRDGVVASSREQVAAFQAQVRAAGLFCMVREPRGRSAGAACGQLAAGAAGGYVD